MAGRRGYGPRRAADSGDHYGVSVTMIVVGMLLLHASADLAFLWGEQYRIPTLVVAFLTLLGAAFVRNPRFPLDHWRFILGVAVGAGLLTLQSHLNRHDVFSPQSIVFHAVCVLLFIVGFSLARKRSPMAGVGHRWVLAAAFALCTIAVLVFLLRVDEVTREEQGRGFGYLESNPIAVAYVNGVLAIIGFAVFVTTESRLLKVLSTLLSTATAIVVISTGSRGAMLWGVLAIGFVWWMARQSRVPVGLGGSRRLRLAAGVLALLAFAVFISLTVVKRFESASIRVQMLEERFVNLRRGITESEYDLATSGRYELWAADVMYPQRWLPFGKAEYTGYPHNMFLEFLVRFGVVGLPFVGMAVFCFHRTVRTGFSRAIPHDLEMMVVFAIFVFGFLQAMTSLSLEMNRGLWFGFGYVLGLQPPAEGVSRSASGRPSRTLSRVSSYNR